jgi:hypothetical protein
VNSVDGLPRVSGGGQLYCSTQYPADLRHTVGQFVFRLLPRLNSDCERVVQILIHPPQVV